MPRNNKKYPEHAKTWTNESGDLIAVWVDEKSRLMVYHSDPLIPKAFRFYPGSSQRFVEYGRRAAKEMRATVPEDYLEGFVAGLGGTLGKWILRKGEVEFILRCAQELGIE